MSTATEITPELRQACDEIHPECKLPDGYVWMLHGETITVGAIFTRPWDPKWYENPVAGSQYRVGLLHQMARPDPTLSIAEQNDKFVGKEIVRITDRIIPG